MLKPTIMSITDNDTGVTSYLNLEQLVSIKDTGEAIEVMDTAGKLWRFFGMSYRQMKNQFIHMGYMQ